MIEDPFEFPINHAFPATLRARSPLVREFLSELACTFLFLLIGIGCVIQIKTGAGEFGTFLSINLCWGFAVMFSAGLGIGTSGGHINPAVTFAQYFLGRKTFSQVIVYSVAQFVGAFLGTALAYANYQAAINSFDGGNRVASGPLGTLCFLVTCPANFENQQQGFLDQVISTGILCATMASAIDSRNKVPIFLHPIFGGLVVMMIGMSYGINDGYPINPARDLGARLFALCIYGSDAFTDHNYWFWVPIVGPMTGAVVGAAAYNFFFDYHHNGNVPTSLYEGANEQPKVVVSERCKSVSE